MPFGALKLPKKLQELAAGERGQGQSLAPGPFEKAPFKGKFKGSFKGSFASPYKGTFGRFMSNFMGLWQGCNGFWRAFWVSRGFDKGIIKGFEFGFLACGLAVSWTLRICLLIRGCLFVNVGCLEHPTKPCRARLKLCPKKSQTLNPKRLNPKSWTVAPSPKPKTLNAMNVFLKETSENKIWEAGRRDGSWRKRKLLKAFMVVPVCRNF